MSEAPNRGFTSNIIGLPLWEGDGQPAAGSIVEADAIEHADEQVQKRAFD